MKAYAAGLLAALMLLVMLAPCALAQETMLLYVEDGALSEGKAKQILALLREQIPQAQWALLEDTQPLRAFVLAGDAPDLAICAPESARPWAQEGLLVPLHTLIGSQTRMQRQVLELCVQNEAMFIAPLIARHRQMAVNRALFEEKGVGYMLDAKTYPVWYPAQFHQILEDFLIADEPALDIWHAEADTSAAIETLAQAIFGGELLGEDGRTCRADSLDMRAGVRYLRDAIDDEMIGYCETRADALERFFDGQTAIFIDWMDGYAAPGEMEIVTVPYPSAAGLPVRSFELTGVCAFASGDAVKDALLKKACMLLDEHAQQILGPRGIWQDGALWPQSLDGSDYAATLRSLFAGALNAVMEEGEPVEAALGRVQAAMDALR